MTSSKERVALIVPAAMPLTLAGMFLARTDAVLFGLSSQFWAGFLMTTAIGAMIGGLALSMRASHGQS